MRPLTLSCLVSGLICAAGLAQGQNRAADQQKINQLTAEVEQLKAEVQRLRAENAQLRAKLENPGTAGTGTAGTGTAGTGTAGTGTATEAGKPAGEKGRFAAGAPATLAAYVYSTPEGWVNQNVKNNPMGAVYRSKDKTCAILVRVRVRGAMVPEMQNQASASMIQELKQQFARDKTEVIEPPAVQKDNRFFVKIREKTKTPGGETATQWHLCRNVNRDMVELTAITTLSSEQEQAEFLKLADEILLSFHLGK